MDITTVVIEGSRVKPLALEEGLAYQSAVRLGLKTAVVSKKQLSRNQFQIEPGMMAVGGVGFIKHALRQLGRTLPEHTPYPPVLQHMWHRQIKRVPTLRAAQAMLEKETLFIKSAGHKEFTGFVADAPNDYRFGSASQSSPVWISTPVKFVSEWRVYVASNVILDIRFADHGGDRMISPDLSLITEAIMWLARSGAPEGYVIDFGVLDTGETALVEMNDGFSFGAYDNLHHETHWVVTLNRWMELIKEIP
jgi:hypothetical protein